MKISCPSCGWQPKPTSVWACDRRCRHRWNTFDTGGVCPACARIWAETQCHACRKHNPHPDWYQEDGDGEERSVETDAGEQVSDDEWADIERRLTEPTTSPG